jgi:hypothetical protein
MMFRPVGRRAQKVHVVVHARGRIVPSLPRQAGAYVGLSTRLQYWICSYSSANTSGMRLSAISPLRTSTHTHTDALDLASLVASTIDSSEIGILRWRGVSLDNIISYTAEKFEKEIQALASEPAISTEKDDGLGDGIYRVEHLVVRDLDLPSVDGSTSNGGRIVAHIEYIYCPIGWWSRNQDKPSQDAKTDTRIQAGNQALYEHFTSEIYRISELHTTGQAFYMVTACHTLTSHLRKGIASTLVQWIYPYADALNRPIFLTASPLGKHVYEKNGYRSVEEGEGFVDFMLEDWGGTMAAVHRLIAMRREPNQNGRER